MKKIIFFSCFCLLAACATKPKVQGSLADQLCEQGDARSCVGEYKEKVMGGKTAEAEKLYGEICKLPKIICLQLHPDEAMTSFPVSSNEDEVLFEHDIWEGGVLTKKRIIVYRDVMVAPE